MGKGHDIGLQPGDTFAGRYAVRRQLGAGNFSTVYEAAHKVLGVNLRRVALKVFKEGAVGLDNAPEVFKDAVALLGLFDEHPNPDVAGHLIQILDGGVDEARGGRAYLALELVDGKPLGQALRPYAGLPGIAGVPLDLSLFYLRQILKPLAWMHRLDPPAVHGDLHFGNVLVSGEGHVRLADFGLAARLPEPVFGGALVCQPPETLLGRMGDARMDVYGVGIMWYEMLTGRHPFEDEQCEKLQLELAGLSAQASPCEGEASRREWEQARAEKQREYVQACVERRKRPPAPPSATNRDVAERLPLEDVLMKCLAYWPDRRYAEAGVLLDAVERCMEGAAPPQRSGGPPQEAPSQPLPNQTHQEPAQEARRWLSQAESLCARGRYREALDAADKAAKAKPGVPDGLLAKARVALAAHRAEATGGNWLAQARKFIGEAKKASPDNPAVLDATAELFRASGQTAVADAMSQKADDLRRQGAKGGR